MKLFASLAVAAVFAARAAAQVPAGAPPPSQAASALAQAVQSNPGLADVLRARIQQSGLTPEQVRARLQASGYAPSLLDSYIGTTQPGQSPPPAPGTQELAAIQALGLQPIAVKVDSLPVDTGLVRVVNATEEADTAVRLFGVDVFRRTTTQFLPLLSGPVPGDYRLGPGDNLVLILTGDVEQTYTLPVTREGFVLIPQVGQVYVANLTLDQLRNVLFTRLGRVYSGIRRSPGATTQFDITVANVRAVQVYVVGEVGQPGAYQLSSLGTVLTALYAAGGVTNRANTRHIELRRADRPAAAFDLYDYLLHGDTRNDIRLETGDVVYVGLRGARVTLTGAVRRPAIYELDSTESLADLVMFAGGLRADAAVQRISVERIVPAALRAPAGPQRVVVDLPLQSAGAPGAVTIPPFPLVDGDIVTVSALSAARHNFVTIRGSVYQPGRFAFEPGLKISTLVQRAGGLQPTTYAGRAHIERLHVADSTRTIIAVELPRDSAAAWPNDVTLEDFDLVTIYGRPEMRERITVAIAGMVNRPGRFPWREGMTLRDLVLMARGPRIGADLREAEVARLPADRSEGQMASTVRVPLDSTYLFDRDSLGRYIGPPGLAFAASGSPDVVLQPYDNVLIMRQPDFELQRSVEIQGEVTHPGTYALRNKAERLADLIDRVGGLTARAYPEGIRFIRAVNNAGRINIDLPRALGDRESRDNVILQPDDSIFIPEYQASVHVVGAVNSAGSVLWRRGADMSYYIRAAGGFARLADKGGTSVRQPNGEIEKSHRSMLLFHTSPNPGPGAIITVPARDPADRTDWVQLTGSLAQIIASMVTILVVATKL